MRDGEMARPLTAPYPSPRTPSTGTDRRGKKARPGRGAPPGAGLETRDARGMRLAIPGLVMRRILKWAVDRLHDVEDIPYTSRRDAPVEEPSPVVEGMMRVRTRELVATAAIAAYLLFTAALMLAVMAAGAAVPRASLIVGLLAVSLPALGGWLYIDFTRWVGRELVSRVVRWSAMGVGLLASGFGCLLAIWSFSRVAALVALVEVCVLYLAISGLSLLREEPDWRQ